MQFLADIIDLPVDRPVVRETTALGAAMLALLLTASRWTTSAVGSVIPVLPQNGHRPAH